MKQDLKKTNILDRWGEVDIVDLFEFDQSMKPAELNDFLEAMNMEVWYRVETETADDPKKDRNEVLKRTIARVKKEFVLTFVQTMYKKYERMDNLNHTDDKLRIEILNYLHQTEIELKKSDLDFNKIKEKIRFAYRYRDLMHVSRYNTLSQIARTSS